MTKKNFEWEKLCQKNSKAPLAALKKEAQKFKIQDLGAYKGKQGKVALCEALSRESETFLKSFNSDCMNSDDFDLLGEKRIHEYAAHELWRRGKFCFSLNDMYDIVVNGGKRDPLGVTLSEAEINDIVNRHKEVLAISPKENSAKKRKELKKLKDEQKKYPLKHQVDIFLENVRYPALDTESFVEVKLFAFIQLYIFTMAALFKNESDKRYLFYFELPLIADSSSTAAINEEENAANEMLQTSLKKAEAVAVKAMKELNGMNLEPYQKAEMLDFMKRKSQQGDGTTDSYRYLLEALALSNVAVLISRLEKKTVSHEDIQHAEQLCGIYYSRGQDKNVGLIVELILKYTSENFKTVRDKFVRYVNPKTGKCVIVAKSNTAIRKKYTPCFLNEPV